MDAGRDEGLRDLPGQFIRAWGISCGPHILVIFSETKKATDKPSSFLYPTYIKVLNETSGIVVGPEMLLLDCFKVQCHLSWCTLLCNNISTFDLLKSKLLHYEGSTLKNFENSKYFRTLTFEVV